MDDITTKEITELLQHFSKNAYRARDTNQMVDNVLKRSVELLERDYSYRLISNQSGELSSHYPGHLPVLVAQTGVDEDPVINMNSERLRDTFTKARLARVRARFPMPVILIHGKYICRSATLSGGPEIYGRSGLDYFMGVNSILQDDDISEEIPLPQKDGEWALFDKVRSQDIRLLKTFGVQTIIDFMVEKKKVKFGMNITSSEKVDKEKRYNDFKIISLPYPGCEFFREFRDCGYCGEGLLFDWSHSYIDAAIDVPDDYVSSKLDVSWSDYKKWDLITVTQNYIKLLLKYIHYQKGGILIHCISGWDRTPLYVSLLRLSLWADGLIHTSLNALQILYFTLAYDWYLFGHDLPDRLNKGEEIFFFCFHFLKYIFGKEYKCSIKQSDIKQNDSDANLESLLLESCGSSTSLNSSCSSLSSRSQECPPLYFNTPDCEDQNSHVGWTPDSHPLYSNGTTTPQPQSSYNKSRALPVPRTTTAVRSRHESNSSLSCGSWQLVSGTGSLKESTSSQGSSLGLILSCDEEDVESSDSMMTVVENSCNGHKQDTRKERLEAVRLLFYHCYAQSIGYHFNNTSEAGIAAFLSSLAERFGIKTSQRTVSA